MRTLLALTFILCLCSTAWAQLVEEDTPIVDNTAALGTGDNAADIAMAGGSEDVIGTKQGEITLHLKDEGVEVFSGLNKVESIPRQSDGWVGSFEFAANMVRFTPAGRPKLECPAQDIANWFGPCKIMDVH